MPELDQEVKEFFESKGEKVPEVKEETKEAATPEVKQEKEPEPTKEIPKEAAKADEVDPHAENHKKALKEEREEKKRLKRELQEYREKNERELGEMREKFRVWTEAVQKSQEAPQPKFEDDPANHLKSELEMTKKELADLRQFRAQYTQATQQQQAIQKFQQDLNSYEVQYSQETPDYPEAAAYIGKLWQAEIELAGVPQEQIGNAYFFKVAQFANAAIRRGDNPAEAVYELAKRAGYQRKEVEKPAAEQKIENIQKGQEASKSLGSGKADADFSLESLAAMSPEDIDRFVADPKNWKKVVRG